MRVVIGNYVKWIGPYQIAERLMFWKDKSDDAVHNFGTWLAVKSDESPSLLSKLCEWVHSKKKRKIKVKLDRWDTWNADDTLAIIILPLLKQLKEQKQGSPFVDDEDVPEHLRSTVVPAKVNVWDTDANFHKRWEWLIDELIWTFEQLQPDYDWEDQYWPKYPEIDFTPQPEDEGKTTKPVRWKTYGEWDRDGMKAHSDRIQRGTELFGKYFRNLWY